MKRGGKGKKPPSVVQGILPAKPSSSIQSSSLAHNSHYNSPSSTTFHHSSTLFNSNNNRNINIDTDNMDKRGNHDPDSLSLSTFPPMSNPPEPQDPLSPFEIKRSKIRQELIDHFITSPFYLVIPELYRKKSLLFPSSSSFNKNEEMKNKNNLNHHMDTIHSPSPINDNEEEFATGIGGIKIERYSDRYTIKGKNKKIDSINAIKTSLDFFPMELHGVYDLEKATKYQQYHQKNIKMNKNSQNSHSSHENQSQYQQNDQELMEKLKFLEGKEEEHDALYGKDKWENEMEMQEKELEELEELEADNYEDTDYNFNYFDNGEDYGDGDGFGEGGGGGDGDGDEGPVY